MPLTEATEDLRRTLRALRSDLRGHAHRVKEQTEAQFQTVFERSPLPMLVVDARSGAILTANHAAAEQYGYSREELQAMQIEHIQEEPFAGARNGKRNGANGVGSDVTLIHTTRSGERFRVHVVSRLVFFQSRNCFLMVAQRLPREFLTGEGFERTRAEREEILRRLETLSARQRQILEEIVAGKANKVIAYELGLSQKTVESHRARVMTKLKAGSLAELVRFSLLAGVIPRGGKFVATGKPSARPRSSRLATNG